MMIVLCIAGLYALGNSTMLLLREGKMSRREYVFRAWSNIFLASCVVVGCIYYEESES